MARRRRQLDGMATNKENNNGRGNGAAAAGGEDRISALPDDVLALILSGLPSNETVRTSVLARRWRHLWRSARAVRVVARRRVGTRAGWTAWALNNFVSHLLLLRGGAPADVFMISCGELDNDSEDYDQYGYRYRDRRISDDELARFAGLWIRHALEICRARELRVSVRTLHRRLQLAGGATVPLVSRLLTRVELDEVSMTFPSLDFSRCPALQELEMSNCKIHVERIVSQSLRRLGITVCNFHEKNRTRIAAPRLVSLEIFVISGRVPVLENMPLLVQAHLRLEDACSDHCWHDNSCDCYSNDESSSVLLHSLSGATSLELTSNPNAFIFGKACKFGTTFNKLKALLLNEWCIAADSDALGYFLHHAPILEKLTLQLEYSETEDAVVVRDANNSQTEYFLASKQLTSVKIKCRHKNMLVKKIVMILRAYGVPPKQISIKKGFCPYWYGCEKADSSDDYW